MLHDALKKEAVRVHIEVPAHIRAIAQACAYDLNYGPAYCEDIEPHEFTADSYATFPDDLDSPVELYTSRAADALREYLSELPTLYYEDWSGCVLDSEPEPYVDDETGELIEPEYGEIHRSDIVEALFGRTIAREFA